MSPFVEEDGTIRVKRRMFCEKLISQMYVRNMLQQEFWIIGLRNALAKIKSRCIKCRHRNANTIHPPMADLRRKRLEKDVCRRQISPAATTSDQSKSSFFDVPRRDGAASSLA